MLYYIEAKVSVKVAGISGPFIQSVTWLVNANSLEEAQQKYERRVWQDNVKAMPESVKFEYVKLAGELH
jgi:hypothetical protein